MKSKIILAVVALICTFAVSANAQGRHGRDNGYNNGYGNNGYNNNGYDNGGNCGNGNAYNNNCNNGYRGGNGYGRRRGYYRPRPVAYCQPVVIAAPRPRYYAPRYAYGRPRININIGF